MDFRDSPEQHALRLALRCWLAENKPAVAEGDHAALRRWQETLFRAGWLGMSWPVAYGGRGMDLLTEVILHEELAAAQAPPIINVVGINLVGPVLIQWGTDAQRERFLPPILTGHEVWCQGFSEPGAGSDLAAISTRAVPDADGYRITGQKVWTSFGKVADWCFVLARTGTPESRHKGISAFLVPMGSPGLTVRPIQQITGESEFCELFLDDVFVPAQNLVGPLHAGWDLAMSMLALERRMPVRGTDTQIDAVLAELLRDIPGGVAALTEDQVQQLGDCLVRAEIARLNRYRNLGRYITGAFRTEEGSIEKVFYDQTQRQIRQLGIELTGLSGMREGRWVKALMRAMAEAVAGGTTEIQKNIIAERLLGLPR